MIQVKFFSSLHDLVGQTDINLSIETPVSIRDVWQKTAPDCTLPANTLCALNMEYAHLDDTVHDQDEVAFFPPVTGG